MKKLFIAFTFTALLFSCKKETEEVPSPEEDQFANVTIKLEHTFNGATLDKETKFATTNGDTIQVSELKYFISNIVFENTTEDLTVPESYHLIELSDDSPINEIELTGFDPAVYTSFNFSLGVDSAANHTVANESGDLDPNGADQMIWSWNTGYKFVRFEGDFTAEDTAAAFVFHIGGDSNYKTFNFGFESEETAHEVRANTDGNLHISLEENKTTTIHLMVDLAEFFVSPTVIDLSITNKAHGAASSTLMNNISTSEEANKNGWFELHHIMTN